MITAKNGVFLLENEKLSYFMRVNEFGYLENLYFGKRIGYSEDIKNVRLCRGHTVSVPGTKDRTADASQFMNEYAAAEYGDYRVPALEILRGDGSRVCNLKYRSSEIAEKDFGSVLPKTDGGETLCILLSDGGLTVRLYYTLYEEIGAVVRSAVIENNTEEAVWLGRAYSFNLDLPDEGYRLTGLFGAHVREREAETGKLMQGVHTLCSSRGESSSQINPFLALSEKGADETRGSVYGFNLIYSGNFELNAQLDELGNVRINGGISSQGFRWRLGAGERFETPEAVLVYSAEGFGGMSRAFHDLYRGHLINKNFAGKPRPIVINSWEGTYFDFDEEKLLEMADAVKGTGIDTFVLDDGWFGERNDDTTSVGDWSVNRKKLPHGLKAVADRVHANGMKFGLWFELEMAGAESKLFREHPEWIVAAPQRAPCLGRDQFVLDLTNGEVADFLFGTLSRHIGEDGLDYIKWDKNRPVSETYSQSLPKERQGEFSHRYILGLYGVLKRLTEKYPHILIESCASGGSCFDAGILKYAPQIWTSDNTDAFARAKIQYGTSYCYPLSSMSCHVSACPNHQTGRTTPLAGRIAIASLGATGYELDPVKLTAEEKEQVAEACAEYRRDEPFVLSGDLYRLRSPFGDGLFAEMLVLKDRSAAKLVAMRPLLVANAPLCRLKLAGLDEEAVYKIEETGERFSGSALVNRGIVLPQAERDYETNVYHLTREEK